MLTFCIPNRPTFYIPSIVEKISLLKGEYIYGGVYYIYLENYKSPSKGNS